jgi:hypothetical protein
VVPHHRPHPGLNGYDKVLKEAPLPIGQIVYVGGHTEDFASVFYYFENGIPATLTIDRYLQALEAIGRDAAERFG